MGLGLSPLFLNSLYLNIGSVAKTQFRLQKAISVSSLFVSSSGMFSNLMFSPLEYASRYKFLSSISLKLARSSSFSFCRAARLDFVLSSSLLVLSAVVFLSDSFAFKRSLRSSTSSTVCILPSNFPKDFPRLPLLLPWHPAFQAS